MSATFIFWLHIILIIDVIFLSVCFLFWLVKEIEESEERERQTKLKENVSLNSPQKNEVSFRG